MDELILKNPDIAGIKKIFEDRVSIIEPVRAYNYFLKNVDDIYSFHSFLYPTQKAMISKYHYSFDDINKIYDYYKNIGLGPKKIFIEKYHKKISLFEKYISRFNEETIKNEKNKIIVTSQTAYLEKALKKFSHKSKISENTLKEILEIGDFKASSLETKLDNKGNIVSGFVNNDVWLREYMKNKGYKNITLDYVIIRDFKKQKKELKKLLLKRGSVVIKAVGFFSGIGIKKVKTLRDIYDFIDNTKKKFGSGLQFVVTEDLSKNMVGERSIQFFIDNQKVSFLGITKNLVKDNENYGNVITTSLDDKVNFINKKSFDEIKDLVNDIFKKGYRGFLGIDLIDINNGKTKVLEINGRMGGATPILAVLSSIPEEKYKDAYIVKATLNVKYCASAIEILEKIHDFSLSKEKIKNGENGVIPILQAEIKEDLKFIVVSDTEKKAFDLLKSIEEII